MIPAYLIKIKVDGCAVSIVLSNSVTLASPRLLMQQRLKSRTLLHYFSIFSVAGKQSDFPPT